MPCEDDTLQVGAAVRVSWSKVCQKVTILEYRVSGWLSKIKNRDMKNNDYKTTLFLPQTAFPMKGGLPRKEPELLERWRSLEANDSIPRSILEVNDC